jgi:hypothetical protein
MLGQPALFRETLQCHRHSLAGKRVMHSIAGHSLAKSSITVKQLNYNACKLGDAAPVTVEFSDQVGEILIGNPKTKARPAFKYSI